MHIPSILKDQVDEAPVSGIHRRQAHRLAGLLGLFRGLTGHPEEPALPVFPKTVRIHYDLGPYPQPTGYHFVHKKF